MVNNVNNSIDSVNIVHSHDSDDDDNDDDNNNNNSDNDTDNNNSDWKACWQKVGNCNREPKQYKFRTPETDELVKKIISETRLYEQAI